MGDSTEIRVSIWLLGILVTFVGGIGAGFGWAYRNFATKESLQDVKDSVAGVDERLAKHEEKQTAHEASVTAMLFDIIKRK